LCSALVVSGRWSNCCARSRNFHQLCVGRKSLQCHQQTDTTAYMLRPDRTHARLVAETFHVYSEPSQSAKNIHTKLSANTVLQSRAIQLFCCNFYSAADRGAEYCDERVCMSVSLSVCVCDHIFGTTRPIFTNVLYLRPMVVVRSSSGGVVIRYVFPVIRMTSYLHIR